MQALRLLVDRAWPAAAAPPPDPPSTPRLADVDVFIPTYNEPVEIVEPTVARGGPHARRRRARSRCSTTATATEMERLALRHGVALPPPRRRTAAPRPATSTTPWPAPTRRSCWCSTATTCPHPGSWRRRSGTSRADAWPSSRRPQYYANAERQPRSPRAAWCAAGAVLRPHRDAARRPNAMFCCGTNVVFRRTALDDVGGFPEDSVTEDFELSVRLHERRLASRCTSRRCWPHGLGPEDMAVLRQPAAALGPRLPRRPSPGCCAPRLPLAQGCSTCSRASTSSPAGRLSSTC